MCEKSNVINVPDLVDICVGGVDDDNEDSDGWDEMEVAGEQTTCLFCPSQFLTIAVALDHCRTEHNFDLLELKTRFHMDCYSYIKMINYIRLKKPQPKDLLDCTTALWNDDQYLKPGEMESWLMYDFDDLGSAPSTPHYAIDGKTPISNITYSDLQRQIQDLNVQLRQKDAMLEKALQDINKMKEVTRTIVEKPDNINPIYIKPDGDYFSSYSHFGIHHEMLNDVVRTESYRDAILNNTEVFRGKTVLDLGCGTSILSMFAAKAGAHKVYGIDQSEIIYKAMDIIRLNNFNDKIQLIKGRIEDTNLPVEKFDIIISEWMGYFLLFEGMLDSFIYARDNHLKEGGHLLPNRCNISLVGVYDQERYDKLINYWDNVYDFNMDCMKSDVVVEPNIETVPQEKVITSPSILVDLDLKTCTTDSSQFSSNFELKCLRSGKITSLAGYFDTFFELPNSVMFSTSPESIKTHWQQTVFYLKNIIDVNEGDVINGTLSCVRQTKNLRGLTITITIGNDRYKYNLD